MEPEVPGVSLEKLVKEGHVVCKCCNRDFGTVLKLISATTDREVKQHPEHLTTLRELVKKCGEGRLTGKLNSSDFRTIRLEGQEIPYSTIGWKIHAVSATSPLKCTHYELSSSETDEKLLTHMEGTVAGKSVNVLMHHDEAGASVTLKIDDAKPPNVKSSQTISVPEAPAPPRPLPPAAAE
jgi:hypothetical protein